MTETAENAEPQTAVPETTETAPEAEEAQGPDLGALQSHLDERFERFGQDLQEQFSPLQEALQQLGEPESEQTHDPFQDPNFDPYNPEQMQGVLSQVEERAEARALEKVQQMLAPMQEREFDRDLGELETKYPALGPEGDQWKPVAEAVREKVERWQAGVPQHDIPELIEMMYLAQVGRERAEQETPAGAQTEGVQLEQGGATPSEPQQDNEFVRLWERRQPGQLDWNGS